MAAYQYVYVMKNLTKSYPGGREVFKGITLSFLPTAKIGVLGPNGAGKSTLMRIMSGQDKDFGGEAWAAEGAKVGYLPQEPQLDPNMTVGENVRAAFAELSANLARFNEISEKFAEEMSEEEMNNLLAEQAELQEKIDAVNGWEVDRQVDIALDALRCPPADMAVTHLSGGERRRVALCRLLLEKPDLLLLDEPTNHLDAESVAWLEKTLREYQGAVLIVTHDRYFLDNVTNWILEVDRGRGIPYEGNYSAYLEAKRKRLSQEEREETARQRQLAEEQEWIGRSPAARQAKSKARIAAYEDLLRRSQDKAPDPTEISIPPAPRLGNTVIVAETLSKGFGDRLLIDNLSFKLPPGGIVGVIGPNGAGKSTLFKMLTGQETPDNGEISYGDTVKLSYVDQSRDDLDPNATVWEAIADKQDIIKLGDAEVNARAYCSAFNFKGGDQQKKVSLLSGGERNRVHMARLLRAGGNVLLLDEPTNDLDVETLRALEDALMDFAGCAVVISHDRFFLDRICTHILAFEGDAHVEWFEGDFTMYEEDKKRRLGPDALEPKRIKYKKFTR